MAKASMTAVSCTVLLGLGIATHAATLRVPSEYAAIQIAIDAASAGDTVLVAPGVYTGTGNWDLSFGGRDLVLRSEAGAEATILDGTGSGMEFARAMTFAGESRDAVIEGLTIRNFTYGNYPCSGILCEESAAPVIRECVFTGNRGGYWASAFMAWGSSRPLVIGCRFEENGDWGSIPAIIAVLASAELQMEDCVIRGNLTQTASLHVLENDTKATLRRCHIISNLPGIVCESTIVLDECLVANNIGARGAGALLNDGVLRNCTFASNSGGIGGGGGLFVLDGGDVQLERCLFSGNCGTPGADIAARGRVRLICCAANSAEVAALPGGTVEWIGPQVGADPRLCAPASCEEWPSDGDYRLRSDSPCLPQLSPCGELIGALGVGCPGIPIGACCDGPVCRVTTWADCITHGGIYVGDESGCAPNPCVPIPVERSTWGRIKARFR